MTDVVVIGAGPAGTALATACVRTGLDTVLIDPAPQRPWRHTYSLWRDEVPWLPADAVAAAPRTVYAAGRSVRTLGRQYLVADNDGLRRTLSDDRVRVLTGTVTELRRERAGCVAVLADGTHVRGGVAVDARGVRPGTGHEQTAFGVVLPAAEAGKVVPADTAVFMDWRHAPADDPTFLYAVPLGGDRVLVEETSLARRPALPLPTLARRLRERLTAAGVDPDSHAGEERVRIRLDVPLPRPGPSVPFGARAALVHPTTGYSIATSLTLAPRVAAALSDGLRTGPRTAVRAARHVLWSPRALAVHAMRRRALHALHHLPGRDVPSFFDVFFAMPAARQRTFTSVRDDPAALVATMTTLFRAAPWRLRAAMLR